MDIVANFQGPLAELERERQKVRRDHRGFLFICYLLILLGFACLFSGWIAESTGLLYFSGFLFALSLVPKLVRGVAETKYQASFREKVTRPWFHQRFLGVFLAAPPKEPSQDFLFLHREAWSFLANWSLTPLKIYDRVFFDREDESSHIGTFGTLSRSYLVFMKKRVNEAPEPDDFVAALSKFGKVRVKSTSEGLWIALRLPHRLFEAPVMTSTTDQAAYESWEDDAKILLDPDVRLRWIAAR
ncbi:MAG: hypothetical protein AAB250_06095 [Bdellovibrionota bacterium]